MKTFQDLMKTPETQRGEFCKEAVQVFRTTPEYKMAQEGEAYYHKHNITIEKYQKMLTTISGKTVPDIFSSNYKLKTLFFRRLVTQQVQYVLGNGVNFADKGNKEKLGKDFDFQLQTAAKKAMTSGRAFGFWNVDHLEVFGFADTDTSAGFCPLYNEETSQLDAGIRYWFKPVGNKAIFRCTLYEADGYTEYIQKPDEDVEELEPKRAYKQIRSVLADGTIEDEIDENYGSLPIIPLYANDSHESELIGIRESIDCYDFIKSGLANDIDDTSGFFWILSNTGGMDDVDLAQFIQRMKTVKAAVVDGNEGVDAQAHTLDVPTEARRLMLELLRKDIYEDFQALDVNTLSAAAKTAQEIRASYQSQDNKCADFEYFLLDFVQQILVMAGINDEPTFKWNKVVNESEQTNMILMAGNYLTEEAVIKHLPFLTPEEAEYIIKQKDSEAMDRTFDDEDDDEPQDEPQDKETEDNEE